MIPSELLAIVTPVPNPIASQSEPFQATPNIPPPSRIFDTEAHVRPSYEYTRLFVPFPPATQKASVGVPPPPVYSTVTLFDDKLPTVASYITVEAVVLLVLKVYVPSLLSVALPDDPSSPLIVTVAPEYGLLSSPVTVAVNVRFVPLKDVFARVIESGTIDVGL